MNNKKIMSLTLASAILLSSGSTVLAKPFDLTNTKDANKKYSFTQFSSTPSIFKEVGENLPDYLIEGMDGKFYSAKELDEALQNGAKDFNEAIEGLTPVEIEEGLKVIEVSAINSSSVGLTFSAEHPQPDTDEWHEFLNTLSFWRLINDGEFQRLSVTSFTHSEEYPSGLHLVVEFEEAVEATNEEQIVIFAVMQGEKQVDSEPFIIDAIEEEEELKVIKGIAINANTISVTFNNEETVEFEVEEALEANVATEVTFEHNGQEFTVTVTWEVEEGLEVVEVSAINSKTIEVTFDNEEVKQYTLEEAMTPGVDNEVTFTEGEQEFTVTVTDYDALVITSLNVTNTQLALEDGVKVNYVVKDQYGEEIKVAGTAFTVAAYNVTKATPIAAGNITQAAAGVSLKLATATAAKDDVIRVTLIHTATNLKKVVELPVVAATGVASVTLGDFVLPTGADRLTEGMNAVALNYTAVDQYGNDLKLANKTGLTFLSSKESVVKASSIAVVTIAGKEKLTFNIEDPIAAETEVTITVLVDATGETSQATFTVYKKAAIASVTLTQPEDVVYAVGDASAKIIKISAVDQFGKALTNAEIDTQKAAITLTSSNQLVLPNANLTGATINNDGTISVALTGTTVGTATIFAQVGTKITEFPIEIKAARAPKELVVKTAPKTNISKTTPAMNVVFELKDQYGVKVAALTDDYTIKVKGTPTTVTVGGADNALTKTIAGLAIGTEKVTFELLDDTTVIDSKSFDMVVVDDLKALVATVDKTEYTAGENAIVTIKAENTADELHTTYNKEDVATIVIGGKTYFRTVKFVNGVATTTVPAETADATPGTASINVTAKFDGKTSAATANFKVNAAEASKFKLTQTTISIKVELVDAFGNDVKDFDSMTKIAKVTAPEGSTSANVDAEGNASLAFNASGEATLAFTKLVAGNLTITADGFTATLKVVAAE